MNPIRKYKKKLNYTNPESPRHAKVDRIHSDDQNRETIKVVSYNIQFAKKIEKAIAILKETPQLQDADILCLQEMDPAGVKRIADVLDYNYVYYPAVLHPRHGKDFGNAILSKWPVLNDEKIILPSIREDNLQRIAVKSTIKVRNKEIVIFSIHMKVFLKPDHRKKQIQTLIDRIPKTAKYCIVAGDFNTFNKASRKAILDPFLKHGFTLATEDLGWTHSHWSLLNKKTFLDHIYTKGLDIISKGKVINKKASDHIPIWAELK